MAVVTMALLLAVPRPAQGQHTHDFSTSPAINSQPVMITPFAAIPLQIVTVGGYTTEDWDTCQNPGCDFQDGLASTPLKVTAWSDGGAGGTFGKLVNGEFTTCPAGEVTSYRCPSSTGIVSITQTLDEDTLQALVPGSDPPAYVTTADDNAVTTDAWQLVVWDITSPSKTPLGKYVMPDGVPSSRQVTVAASCAAYWSAALGDQLEQDWSEDEEPVSQRTLTITTDGNRGGGANDGRLPDSNASFGYQQVWADDEWEESNTYREFLLFFDKDGTNNPNGNVPNWYFYWVQTSAEYGTHAYDASIGSGQARFENGAWRAFIGPDAGYGPLGEDPYIWNAAEGIDAFAHICRHEARHVADMGADWGTSADRVPAQDTDGDWLKDSLESGKTAHSAEGYQVQTEPTYTDHFHYGSGWSDCEDYALHRQQAWTNGDADDVDWSEDGKQW